jgi:Tfp pilus assembly protein PilF
MAMEEFKITLRLAPDYADAHYNLAVVYLKRGDVDMARTELELALTIRPDLYGAQQLFNSIISR